MMSSFADTQHGNFKFRSWHASLLAVLLLAASIYFWLVPIFRPRGPFLWGHYTLKDIYLGIPVAFAALCFIIVLIVPSRHRRSVSLRLVTLAASFLLALAVCDVAYAFAAMGAWQSDFWLDQAHISRKYSVPDPELGFIRKPHAAWSGYIPDVDRVVEYRADENGFRNPPGQGRADIVFIGDSFSEAATVAERDTFVRRVAQNTGLTAINLGRGAYGPQQELIVLKRYGLSYEPRVVVWQLFEGNDLADAKTFAEWKKNPRQGEFPLRERFFNNSLLNEFLTSTRLQERIGPTVTLRHHDGTSSRIGLRYSYEPNGPNNNPLGTTETLNALEAGYRLCQSRGIELLVVSVPIMVRVMAANISFDSVEDQMAYLPGVDDKNDFSGTVNSLCSRAGCSFIDSYAALRQAAANGHRELYIPNDEHLDVAAHDVIAQIITDWLRSKNVVKNEPPAAEQSEAN